MYGGKMDAATRRWKKQHPGMNAVAQGKNGKLEVFHNKAFKTRGGLTKKDLMKNKHGRIVSRKASAAAKKKFKRSDVKAALSRGRKALAKKVGHSMEGKKKSHKKKSHKKKKSSRRRRRR
tara:strand:+ start:1079 stop:1438 length:360 start_codon:yes stop_codon:yes gene_type:complete